MYKQLAMNMTLYNYSKVINMYTQLDMNMDTI